MNTSFSHLPTVLLGLVMLTGILPSVAHAEQATYQYASNAPVYGYVRPVTYYYQPVRYYTNNYRANSTAYVQTRLAQLGYWIGPSGANGVMNAHTVAAIQQFQRNARLYPDGIVGANTLAALDSAVAGVQAQNSYAYYYR